MVYMEKKRTVKIHHTVIGEGIPKICVPLVAEDAGTLEAILSSLAGQSFDLLELRADYLHGLETAASGEPEKSLGRIRAYFPDRPVIFTIRTENEGGLFTGPYSSYERLILDAAKSGLADLADVELYRLGKNAGHLVDALHSLGVKVIGSCHFFDRTPELSEMTKMLTAMQSLGADITKLAVMPENKEDVMRLLTASVLMDERYADRPFITMAMGRVGQISRLTGSFTGSCVTFASAGRESAPGQVSVGMVRKAMKILEEAGGAL